MPQRQLGEIVRLRAPKTSSGASACRKRCDQRLRRDRDRHPSAVRAARRRAARTSPAPRVFRARRGNDRSRAQGRQSPVAAVCRAAAPVRASRSACLNAPGARPSRNSGCFSSASRVGGSSPLPAASAASRAKMPAGVSISTSPPESSKSRFQRPQRRHHPPRQRAVGRDQRRRFVQMPRLAHRHRDRQRLHLRIGRLDDGELLHAACDLRATSGCSSRSCHCSVALDGRIVSDASTSRPPAAGVPRISTSLRLMPKRSSSACIAYCGWFEAGCVVKLPCASLTPPMIARRPRRDRYRGPAAPPRRAAARPPRGGILRWPASNRSSPPRSPGHRDARSGARLPPRSGGRAARRVRSGRSRQMIRPALRAIAGIPASAASICRTGRAPVCRARPRRRRASPCRPSAAPDRRPAPVSRPGRRPPAAPTPGSSPMPRPDAPASAGARVRRAVGGISSGAAPLNCSAPSANASSSSSMSPSATMRGRIAASVFSSSRKISRASRPARRVGR